MREDLKNVNGSYNKDYYSTIASVIKLLRPNQYIKNVFIFFPLFFALKIDDFNLLLYSFIAFVAFSISASGMYILNDYMDIEEDRNHPSKKYRPLASEAVSIRTAFILILSLVVLGGFVMALLEWKALSILGFYIILNIAYSMRLKHVAIIDIAIIAIGFVLRLFVGAAVTSIPLSVWIVVMTFLLALFLALAKRRDDVLIFEKSGKLMRNSINGYNLKFIDTAMSIMASVVILAYILYTITPVVTKKIQSDNLYLTAFFVLIGILRFMQITFVEEKSGSPTKVLLQDRFLQTIILGWILVFALIIYF
jgi:4-hydroxybenzoate polyprenyltransferase